MLETMTPVRLPEGRAGLAFRFDGNLDKTHEAALRGASRANIHRVWSQLPAWVRADQGFQVMMDNYCPVEDESNLADEVIKERLEKYDRDHQEYMDRLMQAGKSLVGSRFDPRAPIDDEEVLKAIKSVPIHRACVDYSVPFGNSGAVVLTNSTTRTVVGLKCPANQANRIWGLDIGFDGTTSTNGPGIVEIDTNTWATNAPGTNSVSVTPNPLDSVRTETVQSTAAKAWTTEPTVLSMVETFFIPNYMGSGIIFTPLTKPFGAKGGNGCSVRITQQSGVTGNATGALKSEE